MYTNLLIGTNPCEGCYLQINEFFFIAIQGHWVLKSIFKKTLPFEIDV